MSSTEHKNILQMDSGLNCDYEKSMFPASKLPALFFPHNRAERQRHAQSSGARPIPSLAARNSSQRGDRGKLTRSLVCHPPLTQFKDNQLALNRGRNHQ